MFSMTIAYGIMILSLACSSVWASLPPPISTLSHAGESTIGAQSFGGRIYYVGPTGDDSSPGTFTQPLRSIGAAIARAGAGDTVLVRGGVYQERLSLTQSGIERQALADVVLTGRNRVVFAPGLSDVRAGDYLYVYDSWKSNNGVYRIEAVDGSSATVEGGPFVDEAQHVKASIATPLKIMNYGTERVMLDVGQSDCESAAVNFSNVHYVIVDGFIVTGSCHAGVAMVKGSTHDVFRNGVIFGNDRPGVYISSEGSGQGSRFNIIQGNDIYQNGRRGPGEGVYIGTAYMADGSDHNHIIHNQIHDTPGGNEGTDIKDGIVGTVVEGNVYSDNNSTWGVVILGEGARASLVYGNILAWSDGSEDWAGAISIYGPDNHVFNNLVFRTNGLDGIYLAGYPGNEINGNIIFGADTGIRANGMGMGGDSTLITENLLILNRTQLGGDGMNYVIKGNVFGGGSQRFGEDSVRIHPLLWLKLTQSASWLELYTVLVHLWKSISTPLF